MKPIKSVVALFTAIYVLAVCAGGVYAGPGAREAAATGSARSDAATLPANSEAVAMSALSGVFPIAAPTPGPSPAAGGTDIKPSPAQTVPDIAQDTSKPLADGAARASDVAFGQADAAILERLIERIESDTGASDGDSADTGATADETPGEGGTKADGATGNGDGTAAGGSAPASPTPSVSATPAPTAAVTTPAAAGQQPVVSANAPDATGIPAVGPSETAVGDGEAEADASDGAVAGASLIEVTNPFGDETVYKDSYSICGVRDVQADSDEPLAVYLTRYDSASGGYVGFMDVESEYCWTVGSNGVFTRSVLLAEGENHFALAACKASVVDAALNGAVRIEDGDIQVVKFTITYRAQNVAEKIGDVAKDLSVANILKEIENQ